CEDAADRQMVRTIAGLANLPRDLTGPLSPCSSDECKEQRDRNVRCGHNCESAGRLVHSPRIDLPDYEPLRIALTDIQQDGRRINCARIGSERESYISGRVVAGPPPAFIEPVVVSWIWDWHHRAGVLSKLEER